LFPSVICTGVQKGSGDNTRSNTRKIKYPFQVTRRTG
jgi:hypothetical protein